ncbi:alpha-L-rhamnosidase [Streptomyces atroolivaceus]|uniref:alpha-L-rhamnosidase n=1 Tax=Streptomyces atroolivaceus TaxID=66869 RepID=A0ABV9VJH0_STRAZ|nr:alpha-L-rhamnosidase [Streptomyces atroolivaceus]
MNEAGWSSWSDTAHAHAPLWHEHDWTGRWISPVETDEMAKQPDRGAYELRTAFVLDDVPAGARLYATALGLYEATVNGSRVGDVELAPGFSSYGETLYAQAYDVRALLRPGHNTISFTLSDGWFRGRNGGPQLRDVWGNQVAVRGQLDVTGGAGSATTVIATDHRWDARRSPVTRADLMRGQSTDLRALPLDDVGLSAGTVHAPTPRWSPSPPVRCVDQHRPHGITEIRPGVSIVDAGQNISGRLRLETLGQPGDTTTLEYAEHLGPDGDLETEHLNMPVPGGSQMVYTQIDQVTAGTGPAVFEPRHTVHGFRYVRVSHLGRSLEPQDVTVDVVHSDLERRGWFACDVEDLVRLHDAAEWSFRGNIVDVPTDCPTRERSGWTGDYAIFAPVATMLYDIEGFTLKWLQAVRDDQASDGVPAMFSPDSTRMKQNPGDIARFAGGSAAWGDALVDVPWAIYTAYGNTRVLRDSWDSMTSWAGYALCCAREIRHPDRIRRSATPAGHERFIWDGPFHFGEWAEPKKPGHDAFAEAAVEDPMTALSADQGEVATAYLYRSLTRLSAIGQVIGRAEEAREYARTARQVLEAWRTEFLRPGGRTAADTQAAYVRAIAFGLLPSSSVPAASDRLAELIHDNDDRLATGFLSSGLLLPVLADTGHTDLAFRLLLRDGIPSWMEMLRRGATTVWEEWEGVDDEGHAHASLNHYSKGAVVQFLHAYLVGLRQDPASAGWERFVVAPTIGGGVSSARFRHTTPRGDIHIAWKLTGSRFQLDLEVPPTSSATVILPDGRRGTRGPGRHRLTCESPRGQASP